VHFGIKAHIVVDATGLKAYGHLHCCQRQQLRVRILLVAGKGIEIGWETAQKGEVYHNLRSIFTM
jgi:hypothetical protein